MLKIGDRFEGEGPFEHCILQVFDNTSYQDGNGYYECCVVECDINDDEVGEFYNVDDDEIGTILAPRKLKGALESHSVVIMDFSESTGVRTPSSSEMERALILGLV